jgi:hypothetical protein
VDLHNWESLTKTECAAAQRWAEPVRGLNPKDYPTGAKLLGLRGYSLLAQQLLLMTSKVFDVYISINILYEYPALYGFRSQIGKVKGSAIVKPGGGRPGVCQILGRAG